MTTHCLHHCLHHRRRRRLPAPAALLLAALLCAAPALASSPATGAGIDAAAVEQFAGTIRAARRDDIEHLEALKGVDWNRTDAKGHTVLHFAAPAALQWLLGQPGVDANLGDPLAYRAGRRDLQEAGVLLADPRVVVTPDAVIAAINHNNGDDLEMLMMLLDSGRFDARQPVPGLLRHRGVPLQFGVVQAFCGWSEWPEDEGRARIRRFLRSPHIDITLPHSDQESLEDWATFFCTRHAPWVIDEVREAVAAAG
jgi:hypothetical protein